MGTSYRRGGAGNGHFDCSGFVKTVFAHFGKELPHSSAAQAQTVQRISREEAVPGDLVFYEGRKRNLHVGHVGILTQIDQDGDFAFIHASTHAGVIISRNAEPYYACRLVGFGRVLPAIPYPEWHFEPLMQDSLTSQQRVFKYLIPVQDIPQPDAHSVVGLIVESIEK